jgi:glutamate synthase domain-containing protein 2
LVETDWAAGRLGNLYQSFELQLGDLLRRLGLTRIRDLVGKTDLLTYRG